MIAGAHHDTVASGPAGCLCPIHPIARKADDMTSTKQLCYGTAPNQVIHADNGIDYAYRELGTSTVPLVLLQHFRGNLENWDSALVDTLAAQRRVVTFDNVGVGATTGT